MGDTPVWRSAQENVAHQWAASSIFLL